MPAEGARRLVRPGRLLTRPIAISSPGARFGLEYFYL
jgi:hypothetical protein